MAECILSKANNGSCSALLIQTQKREKEREGEKLKELERNRYSATRSETQYTIWLLKVKFSSKFFWETLHTLQHNIKNTTPCCFELMSIEKTLSL